MKLLPVEELKQKRTSKRDLTKSPTGTRRGSTDGRLIRERCADRYPMDIDQNDGQWRSKAVREFTLRGHETFFGPCTSTEAEMLRSWLAERSWHTRYTVVDLTETMELTPPRCWRPARNLESEQEKQEADTAAVSKMKLLPIICLSLLTACSSPMSTEPDAGIDTGGEFPTETVIEWTCVDRCHLWGIPWEHQSRVTENKDSVYFWRPTNPQGGYTVIRTGTGMTGLITLDGIDHEFVFDENGDGCVSWYGRPMSTPPAANQWCYSVLAQVNPAP